MEPYCPHCDETTPHRIEKYCPQCDKTLPHTAFHKNRKAPDGLTGWCKACRKAKRNEPENKAAYNAYMRTWNDQNREKINTNAMEHYWETQEKRQDDPELDAHLRQLSREKSARAYERNPDKANAASNRWKQANNSRINKTRQAAYAANPEPVRALNATYYARKKGAAIHDLTGQDWQDILQQFDHRCAYCGKKFKRLTKDHITPLINGGAHTKSNVVPACRSCNGKKGKGNVLIPIQPLLL